MHPTTIDVLLSLRNERYLAEREQPVPEVPAHLALLVAAETAAAMLRERVLVPHGGPYRQFTHDELRTLRVIDTFGRTMRASPDSQEVSPPVVGDHEARGRCSCSFPHMPHDWCDGNPKGESDPLSPLAIGDQDGAS